MGPFFVGEREPTLKAPFIRGSGSRAHNRVVTMRPPPAPGRGRPRARPALLTSVLTAVWLGVLAPSGAWASDEPDHERARSAVQAGEVLPLPSLLERLRRTHPGQVLELELERDDARWVYEVKLLQADGQLVKLELDALTGQVLRVKRKQDRSKDRHGETPKEAPK